ncbi:hypothetical protein CLOSB_21810 [Clostridium beijerinckii]|nr:hypothetical protein CLOSB_21810 [Clostridium beijerinckii]
MLPFSAYLSAKCWKNTVIVLTNIVRTCPAAAIGTATAIPAPIDCLPIITSIAEITLASAASGAIAAPTFIHPNANISSVPPSIIPVLISPSTSPTNVHAIIGL